MTFSNSASVWPQIAFVTPDTGIDSLLYDKEVRLFYRHLLSVFCVKHLTYVNSFN